MGVRHYIRKEWVKFEKYLFAALCGGRGGAQHQRNKKGWGKRRRHKVMQSWPERDKAKCDSP
jgi:hypothetical protein